MTCAKCYWWKRRGSVMGQCWHPTANTPHVFPDPETETPQSHSCASWQAKVETVPQKAQS